MGQAFLTLFLNYICSMAKYFYAFGLLFLSYGLYAQDSVWTLQKSIRYAVDHNIDISQSALNQRLAKLQWQQSQLSQLPTASASGSYGYSWGRSIDPTSNEFINSGYSFMGLTGNADVLLFGWFQKRNTIQQNKLLSKAANADLDQLKDDVSLNVATGFLRAVLAKEQVNVATEQLALSLQQQIQTKAYVDAGTKPELDLVQLDAQVANDSSGYVTAVGDYNAAVLDIKALLNLDMQAPFDPVMPDADSLDYTDIASLSVQQIYAKAQSFFGSIESSKLREEAAEKAYKAAKGALYPQLALGYQVGSNFSSSLKEVTDFSIVGAEPTGSYVNVNGTNYDVYQPALNYSQRTIPYFKQMDNNFRQSLALSLNIPLLNGWSARTSMKQAKIDVESKRLAKYQSELKLQQDVYKAYNDAKTSIQKYYAAKTSAAASKKAYEYAQKRYELGFVNSVDLLSTQNTYSKSASDLVSAKYDMIFKLKVIDYYLGKELKL